MGPSPPNFRDSRSATERSSHASPSHEKVVVMLVPCRNARPRSPSPGTIRWARRHGSRRSIRSERAEIARRRAHRTARYGARAAAMFYAERVQELGKYLKDRQDRFEGDLRRFLNGDQVKGYKKWREGEDQATERKRREAQLRWDEAGFRGEFGGPRASAPEIKTALPSPPAVAAPALGSQAVRVGRTVYVTGQLGVDSTGALVGSDLHAQAERAFANLAAVLQAAGASPRDVTALTIYVVNYRPADLDTIRNAGAAFLGANAPVATVLGVQSLGRDGVLISISATAR